MRRPLLISFALLGALALPPRTARADEGMWPFNHIPFEQLKTKYGFEPADEFLETLQKASVRLNNGGSGAFVSGRGLVMTNHHVASDCIKKLSSEKKDYIQDGFYATRSGTELKCPDLELNVLMEIETVTEQVNRNVTAEMNEAERLEAQKKATARIEKDCKDSTLMRCDVVNLYQGGIFDLYKYQRYTDVRLVFAPEFQAAFFGGDIDNFTYPRYCLDVAFLRVYGDGKPIDSPAYLPLSQQGSAEQDLVLVSGHPSRTNRLLTEAQLRFERDRRMPFMLEWLNGMATALRVYRRGGGEAERLARDELFRIDNSIKAYDGMLAGLRDPSLMKQKSAAEQQLRAAIDADPEKKKQFGGAWEAIAKAQTVKNAIYEEYRLIDGLGFYTRLFTIAKHLYRLSVELPKPNEERLEEYRDSALDSLYQQIYSPAPIYPEVEMVKLGQSLRFMRNRLGADHPVVRAALQGRHPDLAAKQLVTESRLADVEFRKELGADAAKEAAVSNDPMIVLVRAIEKPWRQLHERYEDEVEAVENAHGARIARARFAAAGTDVYPDATFTLRMSFGTVKSYMKTAGGCRPSPSSAGYSRRPPEKILTSCRRKYCAPRSRSS